MKSTIAILFFILIVPTFLVGQDLNKQQPKVALVLGGGGAKGFAHIGVMKVFREAGLPIDMIVGTSIGAIVGGLRAAGYTPDEIDSLARTQDWEVMLSDATPRNYLSYAKQKRKERYLVELPLIGAKHSLTIPSGAVAGQNVLNTFNRLLANVPKNIDFDSLAIPFCCIGTSLLTGEEVDIKSGNLPRAMFASMCVPGVFRPVEFGDDLMLDGGVLNNFPSDVAKKMGADIIIGIDLRKDFKSSEEIVSFGDVAGQLMNIVDQGKNVVNRRMCDVLIEPDLTGYEATSFNHDAVVNLIMRGEEAARAHLPEIKQIIKKYKLIPHEPSREFVKKTSWLITDIVIPNEFEKEKSFILNRMGLDLDYIYSGDELSDAISRLYGYGNFEQVTFHIEPNNTGYTMALNLKNKYTSAIRAGFSLNTSEKAVVNLNYAHESYTSLINLISIDAKISIHPQAEITLETHRRNFPTVGLKLEGFSNPVNAYYGEDLLGDYNLLGFKASFYSYKRFWNIFNIGLGLKQEYFNSELFLKYTLIPDTSIFDYTNRKVFIISPYVFLNLDNLDDYYIPTRGHEFSLDFQFSTDQNNYANLTSVLALKYRTVFNLMNRLDLLTSIDYRSVYSTKQSIAPALVNYASNRYNAFNPYNMDLLGQNGVGFLNTSTGLLSARLRVRLGKSYYVAPIAQLLWQQDMWNIFDNISFNRAYGISFKMPTVLGPLEMILGYNNLSKSPLFSGGLGFQF